jgi:hypothetical protein
MECDTVYQYFRWICSLHVRMEAGGNSFFITLVLVDRSVDRTVTFVFIHYSQNIVQCTDKQSSWCWYSNCFTIHAYCLMLHAHVYKLCFRSEVQIQYWGRKGGVIEGNQVIIQAAPSVHYAKHYLVVHFSTTTLWSFTFCWPCIVLWFLVNDQRDAQFFTAHDTATDTEWQLPEFVLTQFVSPDNEHDVLETCGELKIEINT